MNFRDLLTREELAPFLSKSDARGWWILACNWGLIAVAFALPAVWFNPLSIVLSLVLLANRQLGLAVLMHECAHYSLFRTRELNQWVGHWLCGAPVLVQLDGYRQYHMQHHRQAGTTTDPDYPNYKNYPVSRSSMRRKILRDLSGVTGVKNLYAMLLMNAQLVDYNLSYKGTEVERDARARRRPLWWLAAPVIMNVVLWVVLWLAGHGWLYLLWPASYVTTYMLVMRIRNAAEHAAVPDLLDADPRRHARTTYARWWERLSFAPNYVNYHLEHHWQPAVPCYRLKGFHEYLKARGYLEAAEIATGYTEVIRRLVRTGPAAG